MERNKHYSKREKEWLIKLYDYFYAEKQMYRDYWIGNAAEHIQHILGVPSSTTFRFKSNKSESENVQNGGQCDVMIENRGRKSKFTQKIGEDIKEIISKRNENALPTSSKFINHELKKISNVNLCNRTIRNYLIKMEYKWKIGEKYHIDHDSPNNIEFRNKYLMKKLSNRNINNAPKLPEVYLDESYVNLFHSNKRTWINKNERVKTRGDRGRRLCIIGAAVIQGRRRNITGEIIQSSIKIWKSDSKQKKKQNKKRQRDEVFEKDSYHGNMDGELFDQWYEELCLTLKTRFGSCLIIMDGAAYHKHDISGRPQKGDKKSKLIKFLKENDLPGNDRMSHKMLWKIIEDNTKKKYSSVEITKKYDHTLLFTPPYHPELQPIEMIWGSEKQNCTRSYL